MSKIALCSKFQGPYTREDGFLGYNEICEMLTDTDDSESWTVAWEDSHKAPYMHKGKAIYNRLANKIHINGNTI